LYVIRDTQSGVEINQAASVERALLMHKDTIRHYDCEKDRNYARLQEKQLNNYKK
jgi:hypothetical protein